MALVTNGGRGSGKAIALALAQVGADVAIATRTQKELEDTAEKIVAEGRKALPIVADVSPPDDVTRMVEEVRRRQGKNRTFWLTLPE